MRGGLGPISDMSPHNIFIHCGNSSILVARMNLPTLVTLLSPVPEYTPVPFFSAPIYIERNFNILNTFPSFPILSCLNKTGPCESILIANAIINIGANPIIKTIKAIQQSSFRFA